MITVDGAEYRSLKEGEDIRPGDLQRANPIGMNPAQYEPATLFTHPLPPMWPNGMHPFRVSSMASGWAYLRKV